MFVSAIVGSASSNDTALAAVGEITEYPVPTSNSEPFGITAGPDGNLWFTEFFASKVGKLTTSGAFLEYTIPTPSSQPMGIAVGPDGNLWFTEENANKVAKVTTSGVFTEYPVPTANGNPFDIAAGPDGNLWFNELAANKVAKVTTSGAFTEYPIPTANSTMQFSEIAGGPDSNLWFTEVSANQVAKVTTTGVFTEYPVPTTNSQPLGIATGPDGNLWFTEQTGNKVTKVTTSGVFTEYPLPAANSAPYGIATGPDGNIWFTEQSGNKVANITTSGILTEYPIPTTNSSPLGIAAGPDGNMWFTEFSGNKVAKITALIASPASVTLSPSSAVNDVSTSHTVTATVKDANGNPSQSVAVIFNVQGADNLSGSCTTDSIGQCSFTYQGPNLPGADVITGCADSNRNGSVDPGEPCGEATKAWMAPTSTPGQTTGGGQIPNTTSGAGQIAFGFTAKSDQNGVKGECTVVDPAGPSNTRIKCLDATSLVQTATHATFFGNATVNGTATTYRIDVDDIGEPGAGKDTFKIQTASGYVAYGILTAGNIQVHN